MVSDPAVESNPDGNTVDGKVVELERVWNHESYQPGKKG
jgi:hypothetical protein